jgi:glycosyltransferase involved in cell wall biosynthesis
LNLSVIIPTYKNVNFLPELFNSIIRNDYNGEFEVLVGIDNCNETLNYVYENEFPLNFKFYFFI